MADFVHLRRVLLSPRLTERHRDFNAAATDFRAQQDLLVKSRALDPNYAVKVVTQRGGRIGAGEGLNPLQQPKEQSEKRTPGGTEEEVPEVRYDPKATMQPGQILKLHVTAKEMMTPGDEPNFGWVDPPQRLSREEVSEMVAEKGRKPTVIVREYAVDPRTGGPVEDSRRDFEMKSLGTRIGHGGATLIGRLARGRGLLVDSLGKFRCPPGTPNANQFTTPDGLTCFKPMSIVKRSVDELRGLGQMRWVPFGLAHDPSYGWDKWLSQQSLEEQRYQAGIRRQEYHPGDPRPDLARSQVSTSLEIEQEQERLDDILKDLRKKFGILDEDGNPILNPDGTPKVPTERLEDMWTMWEALTTTDAWEGVDWRRDLHGSYGAPVLPQEIFDEETGEKIGGFSDEEVAAMTTSEVVALNDEAQTADLFQFMADLEQGDVTAEQMRERYEAGDASTVEAFDRFKSKSEAHIRGWFEGAAILSVTDPERFKNLARVTQSYLGGTTAGMASVMGERAKGMKGVHGNDIRPTQMHMQVHVIDALHDYYRFRKQGTIQHVLTEGNALESAKWEAIERALKRQQSAQGFLDLYQNKYAMEFAEAVLKTTRARGMQLVFHEFGHVEQHAVVEDKILKIVRNKDQITIFPAQFSTLEKPKILTWLPTDDEIADGKGLRDDTTGNPIEFSHWTNEDWRNALASGMMDPRTTYAYDITHGFPRPSEFDSLDSAVHHLAGQYFVDKKDQALEVPPGSREHEHALMHAYLEGMAELKAQKRMGLIGGEEIDRLLSPMDRLQDPIRRPDYYHRDEFGLIDPDSDGTPYLSGVTLPDHPVPPNFDPWNDTERRVQNMQSSGLSPRSRGWKDRDELARLFGWDVDPGREAAGFVDPVELDRRFEFLHDEVTRLADIYGWGGDGTGDKFSRPGRGLTREEQTRLFLATRGLEAILQENSRRQMPGHVEERRARGYHVEAGKYIPTFGRTYKRDDQEIFDVTNYRDLVDELYPQLGASRSPDQRVHAPNRNYVRGEAESGYAGSVESPHVTRMKQRPGPAGAAARKRWKASGLASEREGGRKAAVQRAIAERTSTVASQRAVTSNLHSSQDGSRHGSVFTNPTNLAEAIQRSAAARQYADDFIIPLADSTPDVQSPHLDREISQIIVPAMIAIDDNPLAERISVRAMASGRSERYAVGDQVDFSTFTSGVAVDEEGMATAADLPLGDDTSFLIEMPEGYNAAYRDHPLDGSTTGVLLPPGSFRVIGISDDGDTVLTPLHQKNTAEVLGDIETVLDEIPAPGLDAAGHIERRHIKELRNVIRTERRQALAQENFVPSGIFQYTDPDRMAYGTVRTELSALSLRDDLSPPEQDRLRILTDYLRERERPSEFMGDLDGMEAPQTTYTTVAVTNSAGFASTREARSAQAKKHRQAIRESYDRWGGPSLDEFFDGLENEGDPDPDKIVDEMVNGIMEGLGLSSERTSTVELTRGVADARMTLNEIDSERSTLLSRMRSGVALPKEHARSFELNRELSRRERVVTGQTLDEVKKNANFKNRVQEWLEDRRNKKIYDAVTVPLRKDIKRLERILAGADDKYRKIYDLDPNELEELRQSLARKEQSLRKVFEAMMSNRFIQSLDDYNLLSEPDKRELLTPGADDFAPTFSKPVVVAADQTELAMQLILDSIRFNPDESDPEKLLHVKVVPTTTIGDEEANSLLHQKFLEAIVDGKLDEDNFFSLCQVSVAGSNMFCFDNQGYLRKFMPQFSGDIWNFTDADHQKQYTNELKKRYDALPESVKNELSFKKWHKSAAGWNARIEIHEEIGADGETPVARLWMDQFLEAKIRYKELNPDWTPEKIDKEAAGAVSFGADLTRLLVEQMKADGIDVRGGFGMGQHGLGDLRPGHGGDAGVALDEPELIKLLKLKATQNELIGKKVMGEVNKALTLQEDGTYVKNPGHWLFQGPNGTAEPILVTADGYILDGHHRWAMLVAIAALTGDDKSLEGDMNVVIVDTDVNTALGYGLAFADAMGMQRTAADNKPSPHPTELDDPDVSGVHQRVRHAQQEANGKVPAERGFASARTAGPPESRADVDLDQFGIHTDSTGIRMYQDRNGEWVNTEIRSTGRGGLLQQWTGETFTDLPIVESGGIRWQWDGDRWVPDPSQKDRFGQILTEEGGQISRWDPETDSWVPYNNIDRDLREVEHDVKDSWNLVKKGFLVRDSRLGDPRPGASSDPRDIATPHPTDIMYHGTPVEFDEFEFGQRISGNVGAGEKNPDSGLGFHFSPFEQTAAGMGEHIKTVHLDMKRPIHVEGLEDLRKVRQRALISELGLDDVYEAAFTEYLRVSKPAIFAQLRGDESIVDRLLYLPIVDDERGDTSGFLRTFMDELGRVTKWHEHLKEHGRPPAPWESWRDFNPLDYMVPELTGLLTDEQLEDNGLLRFRRDPGGVVGTVGVGTRNDEITREWLKGHGHDGIIIQDARMGRPKARDAHQVGKYLGGDPRQASYVVLNPDQITTADPPERTPAQLVARKRMSDLIALRKEKGMSPVEEGDGANSLFVPFDVRVTVGDEVLFEGGEAEPTDKRGDAVFERLHWKNYGHPKRVRDNPELYEEGGLMEGFASQRSISADRKTRVDQLKEIVVDYDQQIDLQINTDNADPEQRYGELRKLPEKEIIAMAKEAGIYDRRKSVSKMRRELAGVPELVPGNADIIADMRGHFSERETSPIERPDLDGNEIQRLVTERKHFERELRALERDGLKSSRRSKSRGVRIEMQNKINARQAVRNTHGVGGETGDIFEPDNGFVEELAAVENPSPGLETLLDGSNFWAWHLDTRENKTRRARESTNISIAQLREGIVKDPTSVGVFEDNPLADQGLKDRTRQDIPVPKAVREFLEDHTDEEVLEKLREAAREYASGLDPRIRIGIRAHRLDALLADPQRRYKSTHEVEVGAASPPGARRLIEAQWGVPLDAPADVRPISGYAEHKEFHKARDEILAARQANPDWQRGHLQFGFTDPELLPDDPGTISPAGPALQLYGGEDGSIIVLKADRANDSAFQFGDTGNLGAGKQPARFTATDGDDLLAAIMHSAVRGDPAVPASRLSGRLEDNRGRVIALLNGVLTDDYMTAHDPSALIDLVREGGDPATLGHTTSQYIEALVPGGFDFDEIDHIRVPHGALTRNTGRHPKLAPGDVGRHDPQILEAFAPHDLSEVELDKLFDNYNSIYAQHMQTYLAMLEKRREYRKHGIETVFPNDDAIDYFNPETWLSLPPTVWGDSGPDPDSNVYELLQHLIRTDIIRRREEMARNVRRPVRSFDPSVSVV